MKDNFDHLDRQLALLDTEIAPERDLWPQIESAITTDSGGFWQWRVAASAVAATLLIGLLIFEPGDTDQSIAGTSATQVPGVDADMFRYAGFDAEFVNVHQQSLDVLAKQLDQLPPGTRDVVIGNLKIIRGSIAEINSAIEREPNNVQLRQLLQLAYRQEIAIVNTIRESATTVQRTTT